MKKGTCNICYFKNIKAVVFFRNNEDESVAKKEKIDVNDSVTQVTTQAMLAELSVLEKQIIEIVSNAPRISQREIAGIVDVNYNNIPNKISWCSTVKKLRLLFCPE